jgi:hypothetical protein
VRSLARRMEVARDLQSNGRRKVAARVSEMLRGRAVIILPDRYGPGRKHAAPVAEALLNVAASVGILELPGLSEGAAALSDLRGSVGIGGRIWAPPNTYGDGGRLAEAGADPWRPPARASLL